MSERTDFLYPFIEGEERDASTLLADLAMSARAKVDASAELRTTARRANAVVCDAAARAMADRFRAGGRLFTFGNGGSSADAATLAALFAQPPSGPGLPARCLVDDVAVLTALANDVGVELIFSRQLGAHAKPGDIALGVSTSGNSRDILVAFEQAAARGVVTVGLAGYDGGTMATATDFCLVVSSDSVHRIQEVQAALGFELWTRVQRELRGGSDD